MPSFSLVILMLLYAAASERVVSRPMKQEPKQSTNTATEENKEG
ncbi:MAG: hypothetical protein WBQ25_02310 [Nitrososphaeraceae archaeon]